MGGGSSPPAPPGSATAYEECLKSKGTEHATRTIFIAEKKALLSMMSQCLMVSKTVTITFVLAHFSVKAVSL